MSVSWLHAGSSLACGIYNLDSSRSRNASLDKRKEGWTETWGDDTEEEENNAWSHESKETISRALATPYPQRNITLVQHELAWFEQLVLRFAGIPHIVVNSPYAATEATGPLPFLRELDAGKPPVLVGRRHPSSRAFTKNCIIDYLASQGHVSLDNLLSPTQQSQSKAYSALISCQLQPALLSLKFGDDEAWEQVYRNQYIRASRSHGFQPWCIRTVVLKQLGDVYSVEESLDIAREAYDSLETQLQGRDYLLDTSRPTIVDALLWAHLADALCNVHLVILLADYTNLVQYFSRIYDAYFRKDIDEEWKLWNYEQNLTCPFQQLPVEESRTDSEPSTFHDALELIQNISVHTHDLGEVLAVAKEKRLQQNKGRRTIVPTEQTTLYRWRMGGDVMSPNKATRAGEHEAEETPQQAMYKKLHKRNDELWISAVFAVTAIAVFFGATTK